MGSMSLLNSRTELWDTKLTCRVVLLSFLSILLNAKLMLYAMLQSRCTRPIIFGLSRVRWAKLIALRFTLVVSFLAKLVCSSSVVVMLLSRNRSSSKRPSDVLSPCYFVLLVVFF